MIKKFFFHYKHNYHLQNSFRMIIISLVASLPILTVISNIGSILFTLVYSVSIGIICSLFYQDKHFKFKKEHYNYLSSYSVKYYNECLLLHNVNNPAYYDTFCNSYKYYKNNKLHREDGPAVEYLDGNKYWYQNDKLHREGDPAIEYANGTKWWYKNGKRHREDGPAVECSNRDTQYWFEGKRIHTDNTKKFKKILKLKGFI